MTACHDSTRDSNMTGLCQASDGKGYPRPKLTNEREYAVLMYTLRRRNLARNTELVSKQLEKVTGSDLNLPYSEGNTALMYAIDAGNTAVAFQLISRMSDEALDLANKDGDTALTYAVRQYTLPWPKHVTARLLEICRILIPRMSQKAIDQKNKKGKTALYIAIGNWVFYGAKATELCLELIHRMSQKAIRDVGPDGQTPLAQAAAHGASKICFALIPLMGTEDIDRADCEGNTALSTAIARVNAVRAGGILHKVHQDALIRVCLKLISLMSTEPISRTNERGESAADLAIEDGITEVLLELIFRVATISEAKRHQFALGFIQKAKSVH